MAALEYRFLNRTDHPVEIVFSYHSRNFLSKSSNGCVDAVKGGFVLRQPEIRDEQWIPEANLAIHAPEAEPSVDCGWFRGSYGDPIAVIWRRITEGTVASHAPYHDGKPSRGGSLYVERSIPAGGQITIPLLLTWYVPNSGLHVSLHCGKGASPTCSCGPGTDRDCHVPWYASQFGSIGEAVDYWRANYPRLRAETVTFTDCFYDTTAEPEYVEAAAANLSILKSPTVLRQADGALWGWEGCSRDQGCCPGNCSHVWNYAQSIPNLFPDLERTLRETEFLTNQNDEGHQDFRSPLPIRKEPHLHLPAADGQLGGIIKLYRDYHSSGDREWLKRLWPMARKSLEYCIATWDPDETGVLWEPQHTTYDIEFWGSNGMCSTIYLAALKAAELIAHNLGDGTGEKGSGGDSASMVAERYCALYTRGRGYVETELWNGEYFIQKTTWTGLRTTPAEFSEGFASSDYSTPEAAALLESEGPKYQYGSGCLSDGVIGVWMAACAGLPDILDPDKVRSHLRAVFRHNFRSDLTLHANTQRPAYAFGPEGGLLLCSWPNGGAPTIPFIYSDEVWTGVEYQVASHLLAFGEDEMARAIVRTARSRYDGTVRNPFDECECGHWYARAMASYALLSLGSGICYDGVTRTLTINRSDKGDFRAFLATGAGFATVGVTKGEPFIDVKYGDIGVDRIDLRVGNKGDRK
jgi:hypothetical protein